jgi:hypothetical protein
MNMSFLSFPLPHIISAEEFDPNRFLDIRYQKYLAKNPFIFLPFNAGPRICLGQQVQARFTTAQISILHKGTVCIQRSVVHADSTPSKFQVLQTGPGFCTTIPPARRMGGRNGS